MKELNDLLIEYTKYLQDVYHFDDPWWAGEDGKIVEIDSIVEDFLYSKYESNE